MFKNQKLDNKVKLSESVRVKAPLFPASQRTVIYYKQAPKCKRILNRDKSSIKLSQNFLTIKGLIRPTLAQHH